MARNSSTSVGLSITADDSGASSVINELSKQIGELTRKANEAASSRPAPRIFDNTTGPTPEEAAARTSRARELQAIRQAEIDANHTGTASATPDVRPVDKAAETEANREAAALELRVGMEEDMIRVLELEATGRQEVADVLRNEVKEMQLALDLQKRLGVEEDKALQMAERQVAAEKQIAQNKAQQNQAGAQQNRQAGVLAGILHQVARTLGIGGMFGGGRGGLLGGGGGGGGNLFPSNSANRFFNPGLGIVAAAAVLQERQMNKERAYYHEQQLDQMHLDKEARGLRGGEAEEQNAAADKVRDEVTLRQQKSREEHGTDIGLGFRAYEGKGVISQITGNLGEGAKGIWNSTVGALTGSQFETDEEKASREQTKVDVLKQGAETASKNAIELSNAHTEAMRLEALGYTDLALNIERNIALKNKIAKIDAKTGLSPEAKQTQIDNARRQDALQYAIKPQAALGDSLATEGGGGGVFRGPEVLINEAVLHTSLLTEIRDGINLIKPPAYATKLVTPN